MRLFEWKALKQMQTDNIISQEMALKCIIENDMWMPILWNHVGTLKTAQALKRLPRMPCMHGFMPPCSMRSQRWERHCASVSIGLLRHCRFTNRKLNLTFRLLQIWLCNPKPLFVCSQGAYGDSISGDAEAYRESSEEDPTETAAVHIQRIRGHGGRAVSIRL